MLVEQFTELFPDYYVGLIFNGCTDGLECSEIEAFNEYERELKNTFGENTYAVYELIDESAYIANRHALGNEMSNCHEILVSICKNTTC